MFKKYFFGSAVFTAFALTAAAALGFAYGGAPKAVEFLLDAMLLGVLETSLSLDNAVVNAATLTTMEEKWKASFLTWGMAVAVFGMRLIFPLLIVAVAGGMGPFEAVRTALFMPTRYESLLTSAHMEIMAFGGTFLALIFCSHFIDYEKDEHWIPVVGPALAKIGKHSTAKTVIPVAFIAGFSHFAANQYMFLLSAVCGVGAYLAVDGLGDFFEVDDAAEKVAKAGLASFIYLEFQDASFSFDGVISSFGITNNFMLIMIGLGIGAMFVRSMTVMLVATGALGTLKYLEDGAFWGIGWLVATMFMSVAGIEVGDVGTALGAGFFISAAAVHSLIAAKGEEASCEDAGEAAKQ